MLRNNTDKPPFAQQWQKYNDSVLTYIASANYLVSEHNIVILYKKIDQKSILEIENLLVTLSTIRVGLDKYTKLSLKQSTGIEMQAIRDEIQVCKIQVIERSIQLNKILSSKYFHLFDIERNVEKKRSGLKIAYALISLAWNLKEEIKEVLGENYDPNLKEILTNIEESYNWVVKTSLQNEVNDILREARKKKRPDDAFNKYQEAINVLKTKNEKDYLQQFQVALEQGDKYITAQKSLISNYFKTSKIEDKMDKIEDIEPIIKSIHKGCTPLIFAIELVVSKKIPDLSIISIVTLEYTCNAMYQAADILLSMISRRYFSKDINRKQSMLTEATSYYQWANELAKNLNREKFIHFSHLGLVISATSESIELEKNTQIQESLETKNKKLELQNSVTIYNDNFPQLLDSVTEHKPIKNNNRVKLPINPIKNEGSTDLSDEEPLNEIDKPSDNQSTPANHPFDLHDNMNKLNLAKNNNDIQQQAYIAFAISEYYCTLAKSLIGRGYNVLDTKIENLKYAMSYLLLAANKIHLMKTETHSTGYQFTQVEQWTVILLQDCENLLKKILDRQEKLQQQIQTQRDNVKEEIIQKLGHKAWYKNNYTESSHTKALKRTNKRVELLLGIQENVKQAKKDLNLTENVVNQPIPIVNHENSMYNSQHTHFKSFAQAARQKSTTRQRSASLDPKIISHANMRNTYS